MSATPKPILIPCDSCGCPASPEHIRERVERLQLATRYRPIHISLLLIGTYPHRDSKDDFYAWEAQQADGAAGAYITALLQCCGVETCAGKNPADQLTEFQRRGLYLARIVECPPQEGEDSTGLARRYGSMLVKRIQHSYKPRHIAFLDPVPPELTDQLRAAGFGGRLVAHGQPVRIPEAGDSRGIARIRVLFSICDAGH